MGTNSHELRRLDTNDSLQIQLVLIRAYSWEFVFISIGENSCLFLLSPIRKKTFTYWGRTA